MELLQIKSHKITSFRSTKWSSWILWELICWHSNHNECVAGGVSFYWIMICNVMQPSVRHHIFELIPSIKEHILHNSSIISWKKRIALHSQVNTIFRHQLQTVLLSAAVMILLTKCNEKSIQ